MSTHRIPDFTYEEPPARTDEHPHGSDGDVLKDNKTKGGITLRKVEDKDLNKDRDKNQPSIKEPSTGKKKIKEPLLPKNIR